MLDAVGLARALAAVPLISLSGVWHRAIDHEYLTGPPPGFPAGSSPQPLWAGGAKEKGGRFTPKGSFDTLYICSDPTTAMLEVDAVFKPPKGPLISALRNPLTLTQAKSALEAVLDLMNKDVQEELGTSRSSRANGGPRRTHPHTSSGRRSKPAGAFLSVRGELPMRDVTACRPYSDSACTSVSGVSP